MTLKEPDMTSCKEKKKCLGGVNNGIAYDPSDPCGASQVFNEDLCDCEYFLPNTSGFWRWTGTVKTIPVPSNASCFAAVSPPNCSEYGNGTTEVTCTTSWRFLNVFVDSETGVITRILPGWRGQDSGAHNTEPNTWYPLNGSGTAVKVAACNGGWNAGVGYSAAVVGDYDPNQSYSPNYMNNYIINGSGAGCGGETLVGTLTTYSGVWQFSPNASESNITHEYDSPYTPQDP